MTKTKKPKTPSSQLVKGQSVILTSYRDGIRGKWLYVGDQGGTGKNTMMHFDRVYQPDKETDPSVPFNDTPFMIFHRSTFNKYVVNMSVFEVIY
jgi:hypothetical protein